MAGVRRSSSLFGLLLAAFIMTQALHRLSELNFTIGRTKPLAVRSHAALGRSRVALGADSESSDTGESAAIGVGDEMLAITLPNQNGVPVSTSEFKGGLFGFGAKPYVLFFFAGSASPSCTTECQAFRDNYSKFQEKGAEVIGVSLDSPEFNLDFKVKEELPFDLLSDEGGSIAQSLQIPKDLFGLLNGRQTYVVGEDGKVKKVFNSQFEPERHVDESLAAL